MGLVTARSSWLVLGLGSLNSVLRLFRCCRVRFWGGGEKVSVARPGVRPHPGCKKGNQNPGPVFLWRIEPIQGVLCSCIVGTEVVPAFVLNF